MSINTPLILVPCFSGAPWDTDAFPTWKNRILISGQLPDSGSIQSYADLVAGWTANLTEYVLVGDSFGAFIALALAQRQPPGLRALVMSGGFARAKVSNFNTVMAIIMAKTLGQAGYRGALAFHVKSLGSRFDPPGTDAQLREIFYQHSNAHTFVHRGEIVLGTDLRPGLDRVQVPTLILTPQEDRLIGPAAATEMLHCIPNAEEVVLPGTGHLLRFTHEKEYAQAVNNFLIRQQI